MSIDAIGNFLTIIRNGIMSSKTVVEIPHSNLKFEIASLLKDEGFIKDLALVDNEGKKAIKVFLKYDHNGESAIHEITRVSKPGRRSYKGATSIKPVIGGLGVSILTTSKGVITQKRAKAMGIGGEVMCTVW
jgi:small subunit ribosomal protein S8